MVLNSPVYCRYSQSIFNNKLGRFSESTQASSKWGYGGPASKSPIVVTKAKVRAPDESPILRAGEACSHVLSDCTYLPDREVALEKIVFARYLQVVPTTPLESGWMGSQSCGWVPFHLLDISIRGPPHPFPLSNL